MTTTNIQQAFIDFTELLENVPANFPVSENRLKELLEFCTNQTETESQQLMAGLIINALHKRFCTGISQEHIYLKSDEIPQIQLFNILINQFPFVKYGQHITNHAIIESIGDAEEAAIIDIGIGQGAQMMHVLQLATRESKLKKLTLVGIEPFEQALTITAARIREFSRILPFQVEFKEVHAFAEEVDYSTFKNLAPVIIVNASLAIHHVPTLEQRAAILASIKQIQPKALYLIEPNVNHFETNFEKRFINCYHHYYNIFCVIDQLDITAQDKSALKLFFGREIEDVLGKEENERFEKHELATAWIDRLQNCGYTIQSTDFKSPVAFDSGVYIAPQEAGFLGFTHEKETVLALIKAN